MQNLSRTPPVVNKSGISTRRAVYANIEAYFLLPRGFHFDFKMGYLMDKNDAALIEKINELKKSRNAIILAHNFQPAEIQDVADFVGESLELCHKAAETDADVIVMCSVRFMAETAYLISPKKTVLLPEKNAGCPLSNMITQQRLRAKKKQYPDALVLCYLNTPAPVKAISDICCTASNAIEIINSIPEDREIMFVPDQYVGDWLAGQTGRDLILWPGFCSTHIKIRPEDVKSCKEEYPDAVVLAHLESIPQVKILADAILSTGGIVDYVHESEAKEFIIATEVGIVHRLQKENPDKTIVAPSERAVCGKMKLISLESVLRSLETMKEQIKLPERTRINAKKAIDKMMEFQV